MQTSFFLLVPLHTHPIQLRIAALIVDASTQKHVQERIGLQLYLQQARIEKRGQNR
jgi:hypothetical protein